MKRFFLLLVVIMAAICAIMGQNTLTVNITDLDYGKGKVMIALYNSPIDFLTHKAIAGDIIKVKDDPTKATFDNLPEGKYGLVFFQDLNDNLILDINENGIPTEKYGFSNNMDPAKLMRAPNFEECSFMIQGNTTIEITAVSAIK